MIIERLKFANIAGNIIQFIESSLKSWNFNLSSGREFLASIKIKRGIFHGGSLSLLLFVVCMIPLNQILKKVNCGHTLKGGSNLSNLLFRDDLKLFAKDERELKDLIFTVHIFGNDIRMKF